MTLYYLYFYLNIWQIMPMISNNWRSLSEIEKFLLIQFPVLYRRKANCFTELFPRHMASSSNTSSSSASGLLQRTQACRIALTARGAWACIRPMPTRGNFEIGNTAFSVTPHAYPMLSTGFPFLNYLIGKTCWNDPLSARPSTLDRSFQSWQNRQANQHRHNNSASRSRHLGRQHRPIQQDRKRHEQNSR